MLSQVKTHTFSKELQLTSGRTLPEFCLKYETYGRLNKAGDNGILLCHGLTSTAHAAGNTSHSDKGWWHMAIGPGKALDTDRWFIVCIASLGGFGGSTSAASVNPETGTPYELSFPVLTIGDMVEGMKALSDVLGIRKYHCLIGGCMGGFQVMEWLSRYPEMVHSSIIMGATAKTSAHNLALWEVIRQAIYLDPDFHDGNYYNRQLPKAGISLGTMFGMLIWMDRSVMEKKFGLNLLDGKETPDYTLDAEFTIQKFLQDIENSPKGVFDPNAFIYLTKAMDYFDLERDYGSLSKAFSRVKGRTLLVSFDSDWRYPEEEIDKIRLAMEKNKKPVEHHCLHSSFGHGTFLYDFNCGLHELIPEFLNDDLLTEGQKRLGT